MQFEYIDVKQMMVDYFREHMPRQGYGTLRVLKSDPRDQKEIPCVAVNRAGDDEAEQSISDEVGMYYDDDKGEWEDHIGTFFQESLEVRIWHSNADERDKLYIVTKALLFSLRRELVAQGLLNVTIRGGRDEQENSFPPHPLYWGTITMNFLNPMNMEIGRYQPIDAIHVRDDKVHAFSVTNTAYGAGIAKLTLTTTGDGTRTA